MEKFQGINHAVFIEQILAEVRLYILRSIILLINSEERRIAVTVEGVCCCSYL
jgi:hypothetical protein